MKMHCLILSNKSQQCFDLSSGIYSCFQTCSQVPTLSLTSPEGLEGHSFPTPLLLGGMGKKKC